MHGNHKVHGFKVMWNTWVNTSTDLFLTQDLLNTDRDKKEPEVQISLGLRDSDLRWFIYMLIILGIFLKTSDVSFFYYFDLEELL